MKNDNLDLVMITKGEKFPIDMSNMPNEVVVMDFVSTTNPEIFIKFRHLTNKEKKDYGNGSNIEFRYYTATKREYGLLLIKFGSVVQEFIFNPKLRENEIKEYMANGGNLVMIYLIEATTNVLETFRAIGLSDGIKKKLFNQWEIMMNSNLEHKDLLLWYQNLTNTYTTKELWERAEYFGKLKFNS